jgi:hypothetical protein
MDCRTAKRLLSLEEDQYFKEQETPAGRKRSLELHQEFVRQ